VGNTLTDLLYFDHLIADAFAGPQVQRRIGFLKQELLEGK